MPQKINHELFAPRKMSTRTLKIAAWVAAGITLVAVVSSNWTYLTTSTLDRYQAAYDAGRFDEAIEIALQMSVDDPSSVEAFQALAAAYIQKALARRDIDASLASALETARAADALDPRNVETRRLLGLIFEIKGDLAGAEQQYLDALKDDPQNAALMAALASVYEKQGHIAAARSLYERAVLVGAGEDEARVLYARFLLANGDPDGAIEMAITATSSGRTTYDAEANRVLSAGYLAIGKTVEARIPAERALALAPNSASAVQNYGALRLAELLGPFDQPFAETLAEVRELADRAAGLDSTLATPPFLAFKAAYSQKDTAAADAYARRALSLLAGDHTLSIEAKAAMRKFIKTVPTIRAVPTR